MEGENGASLYYTMNESERKPRENVVEEEEEEEKKGEKKEEEEEKKEGEDEEKEEEEMRDENRSTLYYTMNESESKQNEKKEKMKRKEEKEVEDTSTNIIIYMGREGEEEGEEDNDDDEGEGSDSQQIPLMTAKRRKSERERERESEGSDSQHIPLMTAKRKERERERESEREGSDSQQIPLMTANRRERESEREGSDSQHIPLMTAKRKESESERERESTQVALDGGWAWIIALASFTVMFVGAIPGVSFGIIFSRFLLDLGTSSTLTAWIFSLGLSLSGILNFLAGPLVDEFGWRAVCFVSTLVLGLGYIISAFATSAWLLLFSFSVVVGCMIEIPMTTVSLIIPLYFARWRNLACSFVMSGASMSQIVMPLVITGLQEEYGFRGATLIIGAIAFNGCVAAMVLHPPQWHQSRESSSSIVTTKESSSFVTKESSSLATKESSSLATKESSSIATKESSSLATKESSSLATKESSFTTKELSSLATKESSSLATKESSLPTTKESSSIVTTRHHSTTNNNKPPLTTTTTTNKLSNNIINNKPPPLSLTTNKSPPSTTTNNHNNKPNSSSSSLTRLLTTTTQQMRYMRSHSIVLTGLALGNMYVVLYNFFTLVPFAMKQAGFTQLEASYCMGVSGLCNLVCRILTGILSWFPNVRISLVFSFGSFIASVGIIGFSVVESLVWRAITLSMCGAGYGLASSTFYLVIIELVGLSLMSPTLCIAGFIMGLQYIVMGPVAGLIRDWSESYTVSLFFCAGCLLVSSILVFILPNILAHERRTKPTTTTTTTTTIAA
ncbi:hypothetical protein Pcinc_030449 [Petrolisthes cinctipes]|uniref:Uncharacterized protein n=1 Tax=Petrolisthes cinctipes TaxID=88211 RepID=A0AAE1EYD1_PETCI|nr:hypothetical protein Pcinc_030449 [Petrolisthes cinctipes]